MTLQQCFNKEAVKKQLQEVLLTARHIDTIEREVLSEIEVSYGEFFGGVLKKRHKYISHGVFPHLDRVMVYFFFSIVSVICIYQGVAMGIGLCANSHLEGTLAKLEEFGKSDAFKKSPSIFNLLKVQRLNMMHIKWKLDHT